MYHMCILLKVVEQNKKKTSLYYDAIIPFYAIDCLPVMTLGREERIK
jgi:hypothetical protein